MLGLLTMLYAAASPASCLANTALSRGPEWEQSLQSSDAANAGAPVLFIGDSISSLIGRHWTQVESVPSVNLGVWGDASANVLWRIQHGALDGRTPKVVVLMVGENDWHYRCTPDQSIALISSLVDEIKTRLPHAAIIVAGALPRGNNSGAMQQLDTLEAAQFAGHSRVTYVQLRGLLLRPQGGLRPELYREDAAVAVHPNEAGLVAIGSRLDPIILKAVSH